MAATWKKVVVSGSAAQLQSLQVDANVSVTGSLLVSTNQIITSAQSTTQLSGSFTGSFTGDGTGLTGIASSLAISASNASGGGDSNDIINLRNEALVISGSASEGLFVSIANNTVSIDLAQSIRTDAQVTFAGVTGSFSGSLTGVATNATSASYAVTASFVENAQTASYVISASFATSASYALTASSAVYSLSASFATSASRSERAGIADATNASLTQGTGITAFTFDGSTAQTVALKNASSLTNNVVTKWDSGNGQFVNSNITDTGTAVSVASNVPVTVNSNLTVTGDLTVAGTASFQNTENVLIADKFLILASGSNSLTDGGFIIASSTAPGGASGSAFFIEAASAGVYGRFAVAYNVHASSSTVAADEYMVTSKINAGNPSNATPPTWGSTTNGLGNMWVNSITSDIYIWA
jgi:hypothetical protein